MIRGIIFDCFGVLYRGSLQHLSELVSPERQQELMDLSHGSDYGYISREDYFQQVGELTSLSANEVEQLTAAQHIRNESLIAVVRSLRPEYKIALLSNVGRGVIERLFTPIELEELFDAVVLSNEVGMVKPYAEIYELTAAKLTLSPQECIMIDDLLTNIEGAQVTGMQGIVYQSTEQVQQQLTALTSSVTGA
jgi:putative hydrolase of the HAD superfamily